VTGCIEQNGCVLVPAFALTEGASLQIDVSFLT
jgi:hypothetical protein